MSSLLLLHTLLPPGARTRACWEVLRRQSRGSPLQGPQQLTTPLARADIIKAELEEKQFKVKLTVIDTPGFGDYVNNRDSWMPIVDFIVRSPLPSPRSQLTPRRTTNTSPSCDRSSSLSVERSSTCVCTRASTSSAPLDTRTPFAPSPPHQKLIKCHRLKPLDIEIMKRLGTRVNLIPIVSKADTLTPSDLAQFKQRVRPSFLPSPSSN